MNVRIIARQQLNYMNAYNAVCEMKNLDRWNLLVSYDSPVLATDGDTLIALKDATCSITTAKHVNKWLKLFCPPYTYQAVKHALEVSKYSTVDVLTERICDEKDNWIYELPKMKPVKRYCNGIYYVERGEGPWSRLTC